jgi:hypothetical protein
LGRAGRLPDHFGWARAGGYVLALEGLQDGSQRAAHYFTLIDVLADAVTFWSAEAMPFTCFWWMPPCWGAPCRVSRRPERHDRLRLRLEGGAIDACSG